LYFIRSAFRRVESIAGPRIARVPASQHRFSDTPLAGIDQAQIYLLARRKQAAPRRTGPVRDTVFLAMMGMAQRQPAPAGKPYACGDGLSGSL
jgi:hypothetical protein